MSDIVEIRLVHSGHGMAKGEPYATIRTMVEGIIDMADEFDRWMLNEDRVVHDTGVWFRPLEDHGAPLTILSGEYTVVVGYNDLPPMSIYNYGNYTPLLLLHRHLRLKSLGESISQLATIVKLTRPPE